MAHFQRGLAARQGQPVDEQTAALSFGLGRAEAASLMPDEAVSHLATAFDYYVQAGDVQRSLAVASVPFSMLRGDELMSPLVERALQLVPPESVEAGWLLCMRLRYVGVRRQEYEAARTLAQRAVAIARSAGDQRLELRAWATWANVCWHNFQAEDMEQAAQQALCLLEAVDSPWDETMTRQALTTRWLWIDDGPAAMALATAYVAAAERLRDRERLRSAYLGVHFISRLRGDWARAREFSDKALAANPAGGLALGYPVLLESQLGNLDQAEAYLQQRRPREHAGPYLLAYEIPAWLTADAARITGNRRWLAEARDDAERAISQPGIPPSFRYQARQGLGLVAAEVQDAALAAEQYAAMEPVHSSLHIRIYARYMAIIAQAAGLQDKAVAYFEDALAFTRRAGYRAELAWTCCDYADLLRQRNGPGDQEKAAALLDEGLAIARELGMRPLMERILARRKILKA